jgi:hypothetical protein
MAKTWGDIYYAALRQGYDNGYAAFLADQWEKRQKQKMKEKP